MNFFKQFCMHRTFLATAAALLGVAVVLGAFGAHGLKQILPAEAILTFETGVRYHFYHGFALLATGIVYERFSSKWVKYAGSCFIIGIVLFSGSLYLLAFIQQTQSVGLKNIGIVTPFGGVAFVAGWICLLMAFTKRRKPALKSI
jgi:uncharacterized membrane protein YgdD (TMEM256/DUF423 family)